MARISWTAANSGAWTDAANWLPGQVPASADDAVIAAKGSYEVLVDGATVNSVVLNDAAAILSTTGTFLINGALSVQAGTLNVVSGVALATGPFSNAGTVIDNATLELFGSYSAASLERIGGIGGTLGLAGVLNNIGGTLDGAGFGGLMVASLGTVIGGVVANIADPGGATLEGVTWQGLLNAGNSPLFIENGLTLNGVGGSGAGMLQMGGATLTFEGADTLDDATVTGYGSIVTTGSLAFGSALHLQMADFGFLTIIGNTLNSGLVTNSGLIEVRGQRAFPGDLGVQASIAVASFENIGTVELSGTGSIGADNLISITAGTFSNDPGALLGVSAGHLSVAAKTIMTNNGTIEVGDGAAQFAGQMFGSGLIDIGNGGSVQFGSAVFASQTIDLTGSNTLTIGLPAFFAANINGFAPGDTITLSGSASAISYTDGDLKLGLGKNQTADLHIFGPYGLANFVVTPGATTVIQVNGTSALAPVIAGLGNDISYQSGAAAIPVAPGVTISDAELPVLTSATVAISGGTFIGDGDELFASATGTAINAKYDSSTEVLLLSGADTLADYRNVLASITFSSFAADPTDGTRQSTRTLTWTVNDGTAVSAPVIETINIAPPPRGLAWTGAQGSNIANAGNWNDTTNTLSPALLAPDAADDALFLSAGGTLTGSISVAEATFGGGSGWVLESDASLDASANVSDTGSVTLLGGAAIVSRGSFDSVAGTGGTLATLRIAGPGASWTSLGTLAVGGQSGGASLSIENNGALTANDLAIARQDGSGAVTFTVEGMGSLLDVAGTFDIGEAGNGALTIGSGATMAASQAIKIGAFGTLTQDGGAIRAGAIFSSGSIQSDGTVTLVAPLISSLNPGRSGVISIGHASNLVLDAGSIDAGQTMEFTDGTGVLTIGTLAGFAATIGSFASGDTILVEGTSIGSQSFDPQHHRLTLFNASKNAVGTLQFASSVNSVGGLTIRGTTPCFVAGTRISAQRGEVCIEDLAVSEPVQTLTKAAQPIVWIGHRLVDCTRHPEPRSVWPVRIATGAFGPGRPIRDLWLSPDHAVYVGEVLIPIKYLINAATIAQVPVDEVIYYHLELPHHAILLAEGLPAETYLDTGDRLNFANGGRAVVPYPDFSSRRWDAEACAPLVIAGRELAAARCWVNGIAGRVKLAA